MNWLKLLEGLTEIAVFFKRSFQKSEKAKYEAERKKEPSAPANAFERDFGAGGLRVKRRLPSDQATDGNRR